MALDACSDHVVEKMTLLDQRPGRRPTVPISPISPGLTQDLIPPQQKSEITPVPPRSPSPPSDASDSHVEDTIVCAPVGRNLRPRRQLSHAKRRVTFDEVFQDGNAAVKHFIVQVPSSDGLWYILHCDEHEQAFQHPALRGAAAHLKGSKHGLPWYPTSLEVVKHFGVEVVDCDAELAEKNNSVALAVNQASKKPPESNREPLECKLDEKSSPKKRQHESNEFNGSEVKEKEVSKRHPKQRRLSGITRPIPGRIYLAYWETTKDWLPALVLPHIGLEAFGIPSTLEELGLTKSTPTCLRCEPDAQNLKWREGYEHDGTHAMDRQFPVLFFDRREFPENASAGWVKASDLQELRVFHTSSRLVPNLKVAKKYLRKRLQQEADFEDENSWASSEEGDSEGQISDKESSPNANLTPARSEPEQPATNVPEIAPVEEEAPSPAKDEPEAVFTAPMLPSPEESRPGTSSKAQAKSITMNPVTNSTVTNRIRDDITIISISSSEDEMDGQDQPAKSSRLPTANNRMEVDPTEFVVTEKQDNRPNTTKHASY
ncbi:hypothetical protein CDV31_009938 [Fusarium ambrosium]|uniref:PWWP domain-containing protein n=1 Tax=Fusarium ambrosium TaxID=131363 RepID=A0A428TRV5_9HYPO|nr:hypothetical protein CDV31_009938 [Fusarium ambrosium]